MNKMKLNGNNYIKKKIKKHLCTKEDNSSSNQYEVSDSNTKRVLFMVVENSNEEDSEKEYEEGEVDLMEELMSSIEVINREKKKNKKL
jgi:hypothetical protein